VDAVLRMGGWERPWSPGPPRGLIRLGRADGERWEVGR
jgi:hypothetical protein